MILSLSFLFLSAQLRAAPNIEELARSYQASKDELIESEAKKRQILGTLYQINDKVKRMSRQKNQITTEMMGAQNHVDHLSKQIKEQETGIDLQHTRIKHRLKTIYQFSGHGMLNSLFSQGTAPDLDRFLKYLKILSERDSRLLVDYRKNVKVLKVTKNKYTAEMNRLNSLRGRLKRQEDKLISEHKRKKELLSQLDQKQLEQRVRLKTLRSATTQVSDQTLQVDRALLKLLQPSFFEQKGQLSPPAQGVIAQKFGFIPHPIYDIQFSHKGVYFSTATHASVSAVWDGVVSEAKFLEGYGYVVILDHGHHYYSVYGNQGSLKVKVGDNVQAGQILGSTGKSGTWQTPGLYFEVRHFSEPEDPLPWLKNNQIKFATNLDNSESVIH